MFALAMLASVVPHPGQADDDVQLWARTGLRAHLSRNTYVGYSHYLRFDERVSRVSQTMPELSVGHFPTDLAGFAVAYRIEFRRRSGEFVQSHRMHLDLHARSASSGARLAFRLRLQPRLLLESEGVESQFTARPRLGAYFGNGSPLTPGASVALFLRWPHERTAFNRVRLTYELVLRVESHRFLVGYRVDYPLRGRNLPINHIVLLRYRVDVAKPR